VQQSSDATMWRLVGKVRACGPVEDSRGSVGCLFQKRICSKYSVSCWEVRDVSENRLSLGVSANKYEMGLENVHIQNTCLPCTHQFWCRWSPGQCQPDRGGSRYKLPGPVYIAYVFSLTLWDQVQVTLHLQSLRLSVQTLSWSTLVRGQGTFFSGTRSHSQRPYSWFVATAYFPSFKTIILWWNVFLDLSFDSFHLSGYVNSQNQRYGMSENPLLFQEM